MARSIEYLLVPINSCTSSCLFPNNIHFALPVWPVVLTKDFMKPHRGLLQHVGPLPGIPRKVRLCFACDQTPVDGSYVIALCDRQSVVECAACAARHVLRAKDRTSIPLKLLDTFLELLRPAIVVKADHVGFVELNLRGRALLVQVCPVPLKHAAG